MNSVNIGLAFIEHVVFKTDQRKKLAEKNQAMPGGGYPIRNRSDLKRAIQAYGRAKNKIAAKSWIIKRAKELNAMNLLPAEWTKEMSQMDNTIDSFIEHYGVKGMQWGVRRSKRQLARSSGKSSTKSVKSMSDDELRKVLNRMQMEKQYKSLTSKNSNSLTKTIIKSGATFAAGIGLNVARTQIQNTLSAQIAEKMGK